MSKSVSDRLKEMRDKNPLVWVLEQRDPVQGQIRAYAADMTASPRSEAVSQWVILFGPNTLEACRREREQHVDKSELRIRNVRTDEVWQGD